MQIFVYSMCLWYRCRQVFFYSQSIFENARVHSDYIPFAVMATNGVNVVMTIIAVRSRRRSSRLLRCYLLQPAHTHTHTHTHTFNGPSSAPTRVSRHPVASLPASGPWTPPAERGPSLESIYRVSLQLIFAKVIR